jgi:hypothetical protein
VTTCVGVCESAETRVCGIGMVHVRFEMAHVVFSFP